MQWERNQHYEPLVSTLPSDFKALPGMRNRGATDALGKRVKRGLLQSDSPRTLQQDHAAHAFYASRKRQSLCTTYHRLHSPERLGARQKCLGVRRADSLALCSALPITKYL